MSMKKVSFWFINHVKYIISTLISFGRSEGTIIDGILRALFKAKIQAIKNCVQLIFCVPKIESPF